MESKAFWIVHYPPGHENQKIAHELLKGLAGHEEIPFDVKTRFWELRGVDNAWDIKRVVFGE